MADLAHGAGFVDHVGVECMCGDTFDFASGGWTAFNAHIAIVIAQAADRNTLKYGDHTPRCDKRKWQSSNLHDPDYTPCSCGWDALIKPVVDNELAKLRAQYLPST